MSAPTLEQRAREAARAELDQRLLALGIQAGEAREMQADFLFVRALRQSVDSVKSKSMLILVTLTVTGLGALLIVGLRQSIGGR